MTTLNVEVGALERAVSGLSDGRARSALDPSFPHHLAITVIERVPVAIGRRGAGVAVAGDGTVLSGVDRQGARAARDRDRRTRRSAGRLDGVARAQAEVMGAAPVPLRPAVKAMAVGQGGRRRAVTDRGSSSASATPRSADREVGGGGRDPRRPEARPALLHRPADPRPARGRRRAAARADRRRAPRRRSRVRRAGRSGRPGVAPVDAPAAPRTPPCTRQETASAADRGVEPCNGLQEHVAPERSLNLGAVSGTNEASQLNSKLHSGVDPVAATARIDRRRFPNLGTFRRETAGTL